MSYNLYRKTSPPTDNMSLFVGQENAHHFLFDQSTGSFGPFGTIAPVQPLEKLIFSTRSFFEGNFKAKAWPLSQSENPLPLHKHFCRLEKWYNDFNPAFDLLHVQKVPAAFQLFKQCFANTQTIIKPQYPFTILYVCHQALRCTYYDRLGRQMSKFLLRHVAELCDVILGVRHPLSIILNVLAQMDNFEFALCIESFLVQYCDCLEPFLGNSKVALEELSGARGMTISLMEGTGIIGFDQAKPRLDELTQKSRDRGICTLHLEIETVAMLQRNTFLNEAVSLLLQIRGSRGAQANKYEFYYSGIVLIQLFRRLRDYEGQVSAMRELAEFLSLPPAETCDMAYSSKLFMEVRHSSLILVLGMLERVLREINRTDEADSVQARLNAIEEDTS